MATQEDIRFAPFANLYADFTVPGKRCLRIGNEGAIAAHRRTANGLRIPWPEHCINLVVPAENWKAATVYLVSLSDEFHARWYKQPKSFYVVAMHDGAVQSYLEKRYGGLSKRYSGMARYALDVAMQRTSTRNGAMERRITSKAKKVAEANVRIVAADGEVYEIRIEDNLLYAVSALQHGRSDVNFAMMKASNSIAGMLNKVAAAKLDAPIATPFPEVAGRKVA